MSWTFSLCVRFLLAVNNLLLTIVCMRRLWYYSSNILCGTQVCLIRNMRAYGINTMRHGAWITKKKIYQNTCWLTRIFVAWPCSIFVNVCIAANQKLRMKICVNSLLPCDAMLQHRSASTLAQVITWCLTAPWYNLDQCWLFHLWGSVIFAWEQIHSEYQN